MPYKDPEAQRQYMRDYQRKWIAARREAFFADVIDEVCDALTAAEIPFGRATRNGLEHRVTVVEVGMVKGLEVDAAIVVEPYLMVDVGILFLSIVKFDQ